MHDELLTLLARQSRLLVRGMYVLALLLAILAGTLLLLVQSLAPGAALVMRPDGINANIVDLVSNLGRPVAWILIMLFAAWRLASAAAPLCKRVVEEHLTALEESQQQQARIVAAIEQQTRLLEKLSATNRSLAHLGEAGQRALDDDREAAQQSLSRMRETLG